YLFHYPQGSLPRELYPYLPILWRVRQDSRKTEGVAYLTIDEALLRGGEHHRRPGLHVDGVGENGDDHGGWGGGGGSAGREGMSTASTHEGMQAFNQIFTGKPGPDGDCEHLREQLGFGRVLEPNHLYWCAPLCVHESLPVMPECARQFIRVSMPS